MIFGHYLIAQSWTPSVKPQDHVINHVVGWVHFPGLPARYYHKSIIRSIGSIFGQVIRVDYNTQSGDRRKFVRLAIIINLNKPLMSMIQVDGEDIYIEYEGLPFICYHCGRYGHLESNCPEKNDAVTDQPQPEIIAPPSATTNNRKASKYGEWMHAPKPKRRYDRVQRNDKVVSGRGITTHSRFDALATIEDRGEQSHEVYDYVRHTANGETSSSRRKLKETKGYKRVDGGKQQKDNSGTHINEDCLFNNVAYKAFQAPTSLNKDNNQVITIQNVRIHMKTPPGPFSHSNLGSPCHYLSLLNTKWAD